MRRNYAFNDHRVASRQRDYSATPDALVADESKAAAVMFDSFQIQSFEEIVEVPYIRRENSNKSCC